MPSSYESTDLHPNPLSLPEARAGEDPRTMNVLSFLLAFRADKSPKHPFLKTKLETKQQKKGILIASESLWRTLSAEVSQGPSQDAARSCQALHKHISELSPCPWDSMQARSALGTNSRIVIWLEIHLLRRVERTARKLAVSTSDCIQFGSGLLEFAGGEAAGLLLVPPLSLCAGLSA